MRKEALEVVTMLMRTDPFRELDRFTQQVLGTAARPAVMPMDAWRDGDEFHVEFDLPGVDPDTLDLDIENNVVTVRAERAAVDPSREMLAAERPRGVFSRQLVLGNNLDTARITADYHDGVLRLVVQDGDRLGSASCNHFDGDSLQRLQRTALDAARAGSPCKDLQILRSRCETPTHENTDEGTLNHTPEQKAAALGGTFELARERGFESSGIFSTAQAELAMANSAGLYCHSHSSTAVFSV